MLKVIYVFYFLIPLSLLKFYWIIQFFFFILSFFVIIFFYPSFWLISNKFFWGVDLLSSNLIILSMWIGVLMLIASEKLFSMKNYYNFFVLMVLFLLLFLFLSFSSMNFFMFYLFFEASLIPTLILVLGWGYQPERLQAGVYLLFYTLFASLPLLICIFGYYLSFNTLNISLFYSCWDKFLFYFFMIFAILISIPMFFVHLWLPKAHVEAPISGSMILAGVMLKLGGYGLFRVMILFTYVCMDLNYFLLIISLFGSIVVSLMCLRQVDIKMLIAYSSVSHMGLVLAGLLSLGLWGFNGSLLMMIGHGLCSSGLFCLANLMYERSNSRSIFLNKGNINIIPALTFWWFLLSSSNMAAPPSLNLMGEVFILNSLISWSNDLLLILMLIFFFSVLYSLYLYSYTQHGSVYSGFYSCSSGYVREFLLLILHWLPLNCLVVKANLFLI
uniref:NADH-ubiquinone oxidoreductase chain 4 n=1 Tax=Priacma serrata TaxID=50550 RepID=A0A0S2MQR2_PRISE|nr:NADH deshydrogenase subunit 4 [Priacma serrata]